VVFAVEREKITKYMKLLCSLRNVFPGFTALAGSFPKKNPTSYCALTTKGSSSVQTISTRAFSVSAYSGEPGDGKLGIEKLGIPLKAKLPRSDGGWRSVEVDTFETMPEIEKGRQLMNDVIVEGKGMHGISTPVALFLLESAMPAPYSS
jgi:hypothetical protein